MQENKREYIVLAINIILAILVITAAVMAGRSNVNYKGKNVAKKKPKHSYVPLLSEEEIAKKASSDAVITASPTVEPTEAPTATPKPTPVAIRTDLDPEKPMIALTFDDGPYDVVDERILKILKKHNGRATFFFLGSRISEFKKTVKQVYNQGSLVASHTYSHANLTALSKKEIQKEISKTNKAVKKLTGVKTRFLRPPYGSTNTFVRKHIKVPLICWNVDSEDWKNRNKDTIFKRCKNVQDGDIILMHDIYEETADAMEKLVPYLAKRGYQFVTVEELLYYKGVELEGGKLYYNGSKSP